MEEECEHGLPSGTCFIARRLEVVAVAGLLWIYVVVFFFSVRWDFVFISFCLVRTHTAYYKYKATLPHVPLNWYHGAYKVPFLVTLSVCVSVNGCVTFVVSTDCESCARPISTNPGLRKRTSMG